MTFDRSKIYKNLVRARKTDEEILAEMIPYAEETFQNFGSRGEMPYVIILPDFSRKGSGRPLIMPTVLSGHAEEEVLTKEVLPEFKKLMRQFHADRAMVLLEWWEAPVGDWIPAKYSANRVETLIALIVRAGKAPNIGAQWNIITKDGRRTLGPAEIVDLSSTSRFELLERSDEQATARPSEESTIIPQHLGPDGYLYVTARKDGEQREIRVDKIVADAWVPNPNSFSEVRHKNADKLDNRPENLEWVESLP